MLRLLAISLFCLSLAARADDVPFIDGFINGQPARFLIDTGASDVSIPKAVAIRLGIPLDRADPVEYRTAGGLVTGQRVMLNSVKVGIVELMNVPAHINSVAEGPREILLGMSFLRHVTLTLNHGMPSFSY